jgi:hypothetical protein
MTTQNKAEKTFQHENKLAEFRKQNYLLRTEPHLNDSSPLNN